MYVYLLYQLQMAETNYDMTPNREMSFSLGRPDTLGMDEYHNRSQPGREEVCDSTVIPIMVDCARIVRSVSIDIYHSGVSTHERLQRSLQIESRLDAWLEELPEILQPSFGRSRQQQQQGLVPISSLRDPKWSRRQRLVLEIRAFFYFILELLAN